MTKASIMESLYEFEENSRHVHRSVESQGEREREVRLLAVFQSILD